MESDLNTPKKTGKQNPFCNKAVFLNLFILLFRILVIVKVKVIV
jgi:hypothetical protein